MSDDSKEAQRLYLRTKEFAERLISEQAEGNRVPSTRLLEVANALLSTGYAIVQTLKQQGIECTFSHPDFPQTTTTMEPKPLEPADVPHLE